MDDFSPYQQLAEKNGWQYGDMCSADRFWLFPADPMLNRKWCYIKKDDVLFWAYDMYGSKMGMSQTYSGIFRWLELPDKDFQCTVSPRFWLNFLGKGKRTKLGDAFLDEKVSVVTNDRESARRMVTGGLVRAYLDLPEEILPLDIVMGVKYLPEFKGYEGYQVVGLESNGWLTAGQIGQYWPVMEDVVRRIGSQGG